MFNEKINYRVSLNTDTNLFTVFDKFDENKFATGISIEQAIARFKNAK